MSSHLETYSEFAIHGFQSFDVALNSESSYRIRTGDAYRVSQLVFQHQLIHLARKLTDVAMWHQESSAGVLYHVWGTPDIGRNNRPLKSLSLTDDGIHHFMAN